MLDENLGDALLKLDLSPQTDAPAAQIERIIDADRRRVKRWTRIAVGLWIVAALGTVFIFCMGGLTFPVIQKMVMEENAKATAGAAADHGKVSNAPKGTLDEPDTPFLMLAKLVAMTMVFGTGSFMILILAGLATVLLMIRSRSATLRQINTNLMQITEQLKHVPPASSATGGT